MIYRLKEISLEAYLEETLRILDEEYSECDLDDEEPEFRYAKKEDRNVVEANHIRVLEMKRPGEKVEEKVKRMDDDTLAGDIILARIDAKQSNEVHQFHAAKAFNSYIDQVVEASCKRARERFEK